MKNARNAWLLIGVGLALCIPATFFLISYIAGLNDAEALGAAPICAAPTQDESSTCLSEFKGNITAVTHTRSLDRATLAIGGASYDVGYDCAGSPAGACAAILFTPGTPIVAGWWRGQPVLIGAAESRPAVVTDLHPLDQLRAKVLLMEFLVVPAVSFVVAGTLRMQAPMSVDDIVKSALAKWPNPPRLVDRRLIWRVALGYWAPYGLMVWFIVDLIASLVLIGFRAFGSALPVLAASFAVTLAASAVITGRYLTETVRTTDRRSLTVRAIKTGLGRSGRDTRVSYDLLNGNTATTTLNLYWNGQVNVGDVLDALTDPKSGSIVRLLSTPPAQA